MRELLVVLFVFLMNSMIHFAFDVTSENQRCRRFYCYGSHENIAIRLKSIEVDGVLVSEGEFKASTFGNLRLEWDDENTLLVRSSSSQPLTQPIVVGEETYTDLIWDYTAAYEKK